MLTSRLRAMWPTTRRCVTFSTVSRTNAVPEKLPNAESAKQSTFNEAEQSVSQSDEAISTTEQHKQQRYDKLKDISRMKPYHRMLINDQMIPPNMFKWQSEQWALRQRYAMYGKASGVDPKWLWPTKEELAELKAHEAIFKPDLMYNIQALKKVTEEKTKELEARDKMLEDKLKNYKKEMAAYRALLRDRQQEQLEAEQRRKKKIQEIQEYFGYAVDPKDPRFQAMYDKKEEEEKKALKLAKTEAKKAQLLQSLAGIAPGGAAVPQDDKSQATQK